jgi:hypothetical protein
MPDKPSGTRSEISTPAALLNPTRERVAALMGERTMSVSEVVVLLANEGESMPRAHLFTLLSMSMRTMVDQGRRTRVHVFTALEGGRFRVATTEDVQRELMSQTAHR